MNGQFWVPQPASIASPGEVAAYLLQRGWKLEKSAHNWAEYSKASETQDIVIEVPQEAGARDYPRVLGHMMDDLARLESRPPSSVLSDIKASSVDRVRLAIESTMTRDGRIPVEPGRRVYEAARNLLLSAACSVIDPRSVFAKRKPDEAMDLLKRARFGQTEAGSFILTMECTIAPRLQPALLPEDWDPDAPLERRACVKLAQGLQGAEAASRESGASMHIEPFRKRAGDGVSANLCEAVAELIEATDAESVRASFSFASHRPIQANVPGTTLFTSDLALLLREGAARLRDEATYHGTDVKGFVVKLTSPEASRGGEAVILASIEDKERSIRVPLEATPYQIAIQAHRDVSRVHCVGDLAREGRSWVLRNPRDFAVTIAEDI